MRDKIVLIAAMS